MTATIEAYFEAWNSDDPSARRDAISRAYTHDAVYCDPMSLARGAGEIDAMIAGVRTQFPGHTFALSSALDEHHDLVRFGWTMTAPTGDVAVEGIDVVEVRDGRLARVSGFFGATAPVEAGLAG